jgi:uncharacterized membrane protein
MRNCDHVGGPESSYGHGLLVEDHLRVRDKNWALLLIFFAVCTRTMKEISVLLYLAVLLLGIVAGLRAFIAPAAVSWFACIHPTDFSGTWASFMTSVWAGIIFSVLAIVELVTDQLPKTPSRKVPMQLVPRLVSGCFCGAVLGAPSGSSVGCAFVGIIGAAIGTFGGAEFRSRLAKLLGGKDHPAALIEDVVALAIAFVAVVIL